MTCACHPAPTVTLIDTNHPAPTVTLIDTNHPDTARALRKALHNTPTTATRAEIVTVVLDTLRSMT